MLWVDWLDCCDFGFCVILWVVVLLFWVFVIVLCWLIVVRFGIFRILNLDGNLLFFVTCVIWLVRTNYFVRGLGGLFCGCLDWLLVCVELMIWVSVRLALYYYSVIVFTFRCCLIVLGSLCCFLLVLFNFVLLFTDTVYIVVNLKFALYWTGWWRCVNCWVVVSVNWFMLCLWVGF